MPFKPVMMSTTTALATMQLVQLSLQLPQAGSAGWTNMENACPPVPWQMQPVVLVRSAGSMVFNSSKKNRTCVQLFRAKTAEIGAGISRQIRPPIVEWFDEWPFLFAENAIITVVVVAVTKFSVVIAVVTVVVTIRIPVVMRHNTDSGVSWCRIA